MENTHKVFPAQKGACTNMQHSTVLNVALLISTVSASFVGAKYFGISVPVAGQLPLIIYVALRGGSRIKLPYKSPVLWFAITAAFSSLISLFLPYWNLDGYVSGNTAFFITCTAVTIPLIIAIYNLPDGYRSLRWALTWACRFECIWGLAQLVIYTIFSVNISQVVFGDMLHLTNTNDWLTIYNAGTAIDVRTEMRLTGTTQDGAFFGLFVVIGLVLDNSKLMKIAYIIAAIVGVQRATLVCMAVVFSAYAVIWLRSAKERNRRRSFTAMDFLLFIVGVGIVTIVFVRYGDIIFARMALTLARFNVTGNDGTDRHLMYVPWILSILLISRPNVMLFGVGLRSSGVLLSDSHGPYYRFLNSYMQGGRSWAVESDVASVFGGCGFVGGIVYIYMFCHFLKWCNRDCKVLAIAILCFAAMYDFSSLMIGFLIYSLLMANIKENRKIASEDLSFARSSTCRGAAHV